LSDPAPTSAAWDLERAGSLLLRFGPAALLVALAIAAYSSGLVGHINLTELQGRRLSLEEFVAVRPLVSALIYVSMFTVAVSLSLPLALILCLCGGFLFGALEAGFLASLSSTLGGMVMFFVARTAVGDILGRLAGPRIAKLRVEAKKDAFALVLTLRLIPMMPFWLINVGAALVGIPFRTFAIATALGVMPSCFIYASLGSGLGSLFDRGVTPNGRMVLEPEVLVPLLALALLGILPLAYRLVRSRWASR
jgi:uncharacterized membrane protein YdjX (TVP38/TMEM64 family)